MNKIFKKTNQKEFQKGSIILLVVLLLAGILIVSLGASTIISRGLQTGRTQSDSTVAYFAAETAVERYMEEYYKEGTNPGSDGTVFYGAISNGSRYLLEYERDGEENVLKAYGYYGDSNRFIEKRFEDPVPPENPVENMALSHISNNKNFTISWTAGIGNGTCRLQFHQNGSNWIDILSATSLDCDNDLNQSFDLNPDGWKANWDATSVRIVRNSDDQEVGIFTQDLSCSGMGASSVSTPSIDEDCNGQWDNFTQVTECKSCDKFECKTCTIKYCSLDQWRTNDCKYYVWGDLYLGWYSFPRPPEIFDLAMCAKLVNKCYVGPVHTHTNAQWQAWRLGYFSLNGYYPDPPLGFYSRYKCPPGYDIQVGGYPYISSVGYSGGLRRSCEGCGYTTISYVKNCSVCGYTVLSTSYY